MTFNSELFWVYILKSVASLIDQKHGPFIDLCKDLS